MAPATRNSVARGDFQMEMDWKRVWKSPFFCMLGWFSGWRGFGEAAIFLDMIGRVLDVDDEGKVFLPARRKSGFSYRNSISAMKKSLLLSLAAISSVALVSCYPLPDPIRKGSDKPTDQPSTLTSDEQKELAELREKKRLEEEEKKKQEELAEKEKEVTGETTLPKPPERRPGEYPFANPVPGKDGFVFSPYNNKLVDVRDIASGTLVRDPTYPAEEKKFFRVP